MDFNKKRVLSLVLFVWVMLLPFIMCQSSHGDTHYVTDILILTLREGPGDEYKVIRSLKSDMPVEILEENEHYLKVRTSENDVGWVVKQYITAEPPKTIIIAEMKKTIDQLNEKNSKLEKNLTALMNDFHAAQMKVKALEEAVETSKKELNRKNSKLKEITDKYNAILAQPQSATKPEVDTLKGNDEITLLNRELEAIKKENIQLRLKQTVWVFVAGGVVFLVGLIAGFLSSKKREKKLFYLK